MNIRNVVLFIISLAFLQKENISGSVNHEPTAIEKCTKIVEDVLAGKNVSYDITYLYTYEPVTFVEIFTLKNQQDNSTLLHFLAQQNIYACTTTIKHLCQLLKENPPRTSLSQAQLSDILLAQDTNGIYFLRHITNHQCAYNILNTIQEIDQQTTDKLYAQSCVYQAASQQPSPTPSMPIHPTNPQPTFALSPYLQACNKLHKSLTKGDSQQELQQKLSDVQSISPSFSFEDWLIKESKATFKNSNTRNPLFKIIENDFFDTLTFVFSNMKDQNKKNSLILSQNKKNNRNILYTAAFKKDKKFLEAIKSNIDTATWHQALTTVDTNGGNVLHYAINHVNANMDVIEFIVTNCDDLTLKALLTTKDNRNKTVLELTQERIEQLTSNHAHVQTLKNIETYITQALNRFPATAAAQGTTSPLLQNNPQAQSSIFSSKKPSLHAASIFLCIPALYDWYEWNQVESKTKKNVANQNEPQQTPIEKYSWYLKDLFTSPLRHKKIWASLLTIVGLQWCAYKL